MSKKAQETRPLVEWLEAHRATRVIRKRKRDREAARAHARKYYAANKAKFLHRASVRVSRKKGVVADLAEAEWADALHYFDGCAYCGAKRGPFHREHIHPASKGGGLTRRNIVPACISCNQSKKDRLLHDWYKFTEFYSDERLFRLVGWIFGVAGQQQVRALSYLK